jgi:OmpA-OmpF porin, OOP family
MHASVLKAAFVTALLTSSFAAMADSASVTQTGAFVSVTGGKSLFDVDRDPSGRYQHEDDNGTAFGVLGGYRWVVARPFAVGVEAGYVNLGDTTWRAHYGGLSIQHDVQDKSKANAFLVGINGKWDLPYDFTVTAHAGLAHMRAKGHYTESGGLIFQPSVTTRSRYSWSGNRIYGGVGIGYDFNENVGLSLSYDRYSYKAAGPRDPGKTAHIGLLGLTMEYRFW